MRRVLPLKGVDPQCRLRIQLSAAAHAYEKHNQSFLSDVDYDALSRRVDTTLTTGNRKMDKFFRDNFHSDTGMWIHRHPEREKLEVLYQKFYKARCL
jgi:hypothetical protein